MGIINVLSFEVANLIAAGEVVDRPGSVIKELVENAIDAGATRVTVEIQRGGVRFMRVTDNGKGMSSDDLPVAIRRHATSKIKDATDLEAIMTLGFRGEALAAICSVSDVRIISKQKNDAMGSTIAVHSGRAEPVSEMGAADGTTVIVENLFANVPARLKFLKRDMTEGAYVAAIVEKIALSHPEIAFKFINDGSLKLNTSGDGSLPGVIRSVMGREFAAKTLSAESEVGGIRVFGYITAPDVPRANRNFQNFFINGRYVKSKTASAAIEQAYKSYIPPEKFPGCILKIEISPEAVDVNVHPSKLEVKFSDERPVFDAVYRAVRDALLSNTLRPGGEIPAEIRTFDKPKPHGPAVSGAFTPVRDRADSPKEADPVQLEIKDATPSLYSVPSAEAAPSADATASVKGASSGESVPFGNGVPSGFSPASAEDRENFRRPVTGLGAFGGKYGTALSGYNAPQRPAYSEQRIKGNACDSAAKPSDSVPKPGSFGTAASNDVRKNLPADDDGIIEAEKTNASQAPASEPKPAFNNYTIIGELFNSYILVQEGDRVTVIDKHAAHERLNFEKMRRSLKEDTHPVTYLAVPLVLSLSNEEIAALEDCREQIDRLGFEFSCTSGLVKITGIPMEIRTEDAVPMFESFADVLVNGTGNVELVGETAFEKALYQASCKASIKAGRVYPEGYDEWLVAELRKNPEVTYCPHGRPVAFELKKNDIDRKFKRN